MELAAVGALGLASAVAIASAVYFAEHGVVFYLMGGFGPTGVAGDGHLTVWIVVAAAATAALVALVRGWRLAAGVLSGLVTVYLLVVTAVLVYRSSVKFGGHLTVFHAFSGQEGFTGYSSIVGGLFSFRYGSLVATPALVGISVVATGLAAAAALRGRPRQRGARRLSWVWLAAAGGLAVLFAVIGDGSGAAGSANDLSFSVPAQGGIMTALQWVWGIGVVAGLVSSRLDPRVGWATAVLSLPFIAYQVSSLTLGKSYYGELGQPWWQTDLPLIAGTAAIIGLVTSSILTSRRMRTPPP